MPNTRTITIEVPDYTSPAEAARNNILACETERQNLKHNTDNYICSIVKQIEAYLQNVFLPLRDVPCPSFPDAHHPVCGRISGGADEIRFEHTLGFRAIYTIKMEFVLNLQTGRLMHNTHHGYDYGNYKDGLGFVEKCDGSLASDIGRPAYAVGMLVDKWPMIKSAVNRWVADEIANRQAAFEKALDNERALNTSIASFTI